MSNQDQHNPQANNNEQDFQRWLDGDLTPEQAQQFENNIAQDPETKERLATARFIEQQVYCYEEQSVPNWDRASSFESDKSSWWQWRGMPIAAMCCSIFAVALVIFQVEFIMEDNGMLVRFGGSPQGFSQQQVEQLVDLRLKEFASEQQVVLANFSSDFKQLQQDNNLQLASYIINTSRQERKEDMSDFISYMSEQRKDDQFDQKMRFQQLEYALKQNNSLPLQNISHDLTGAQEK